MRLNFKHVEVRKPRDKAYYFFFKRGMAKPERLPGVPGTQEFAERYDALLREHAPQHYHASRGRADRERGTLAWVIEQFTAADALPWSTMAESTRAKYRLRFNWLSENYGTFLLAALERDDVKDIRRKLQAEPSVANETIDRIGQLWRWSDETLTLTGDAKLKSDPTQGVARIKVEKQSALIWPQELCSKFENCGHEPLITFYFLARYSGQRRGDCLKMQWADFDADAFEGSGGIYVTQEKTDKKLWIPCHSRLRARLDTLPRNGAYILTSTRTGRTLSESTVSSTIAEICTDLGFSGYSPHGLRHGAATAIIAAGGTVDQAMAVTGHANRSQLDRYLQELNQRSMAAQAMAKWEAADARAAVLAEPNVVAFEKRAS
jgi:integrase